MILAVAGEEDQSPGALNYQRLWRQRSKTR
jgi:hypothetical protein